MFIHQNPQSLNGISLYITYTIVQAQTVYKCWNPFSLCFHICCVAFNTEIKWFYVKRSKISLVLSLYLILCYLKDYLNELIAEKIYGYSSVWCWGGGGRRKNWTVTERVNYIRVVDAFVMWHMTNNSLTIKTLLRNFWTF